MHKLIPGSLNALATLARNGGAPAPALAPSPGGGGGGSSGTNNKRKRGSKGTLPNPKSPFPAGGSPQTRCLLLGSLASCCS